MRSMLKISRAMASLAALVILAGCTKPDAVETRGPAVAVGEPVIVPGEGSGGPFFTLSPGKVVLARGDRAFESADGGLTWKDRPALPSSLLLRRTDGSFYGLKGRAPHLGEGRFQGEAIRAQRLDELPNVEWEEVSLSVPRWTPMTDDMGRDLLKLNIYRPLLELEEGRLLLATYNNLQGDTVPMGGFIPDRGQKWYKYRTYLLASEDNGRTWTYLSTIAYDGESGQESFCEPAIVDLGAGELLAVMRTGRFAPMFQSRSLDGGKTWQNPRPMKVLGLAPRMVLLENGALVCTFGWRPTKNQVVGAGQPAALALENYHVRYRDQVGLEDPSGDAGDYVMVSLDKGHTWSEPQKLAEPLTTGYTLLAKTGPDSCVVLTRRVVLPGESREGVLDKWAHDWDWKNRSRRVLEARRIMVGP